MAETAPLIAIPGIGAYHAHIYFNAETLDQAVKLSEAAAERFALQLGRVHQRLVGPHACWSRQLAFEADQFDGLIRWLDSHRDGLSVFVHGVSDDDLTDHTEHARWLGEPQPLKLSMFES